MENFDKGAKLLIFSPSKKLDDLIITNYQVCSCANFSLISFRSQLFRIRKAGTAYRSIASIVTDTKTLAIEFEIVKTFFYLCIYNINISLAFFRCPDSHVRLISIMVELGPIQNRTTGLGHVIADQVCVEGQNGSSCVV